MIMYELSEVTMLVCDFFTCVMSNLFDNLCMDSKYTIYYLVFKFFVIRKINIFLVFVY